MLIEPVFISWREDRLPNKLVNTYQKAALFQAIGKKAACVAAAQPARGAAAVLPHVAEAKQFV